jgi:hypothetical protein
MNSVECVVKRLRKRRVMHTCMFVFVEPKNLISAAPDATVVHYGANVVHYGANQSGATCCKHDGGRQSGSLALPQGERILLVLRKCPQVSLSPSHYVNLEKRSEPQIVYSKEGGK